VTVTADETQQNAISVVWKRVEKSNSQVTHPGVYCLRTNLTGWDEATLWHTYTMLTDLESVFRSLKSELGLRPVYHHKEERVNGHIFITLIAYHLVQILRVQLKSRDCHDSWQTIRRKMEN
jgi:transposase